MNKYQILELLSRPGLIANINVAELETVVKKYPYFSVGQMLLAMKYNEQKNILAQQQISKAALSSNDRAKFRELISENEIANDTAMEKESSNDYAAIENVSGKNSEAELHQLLSEIQNRKHAILKNEEIAAAPVISKKESIEDADITGALEEIAAAGAEYIPTAFLESENEEEEFAIESDAEIVSNNLIEEEFILHDLEIESNENEILRTSEVEGVKEIEEENNMLVEDEDLSAAEIVSEHFIDQQASTAKSESADVEQDFRINETVSTPGEFLPDKSFSFTGWLKFFSMDKMKREFPVNSQQELMTEEKTEPQKTLTEEPLFKQNMESDFESIDKIVSAIKPVTQPKVISAEDLAKKSSELNEEIVSETLATIYEEQALYDKAIRMYVKLSLKYPSKVSLFAARIKELKNKK